MSTLFPEKETCRKKLSSNAATIFRTSSNDPSVIAINPFVEKYPSYDEKFIKKSTHVKETSFLFKMRPRVSRLPFKK